MYRNENKWLILLKPLQWFKQKKVKKNELIGGIKEDTSLHTCSLRSNASATWSIASLSHHNDVYAKSLHIVQCTLCNAQLTSTCCFSSSFQIWLWSCSFEECSMAWQLYFCMTPLHHAYMLTLLYKFYQRHLCPHTYSIQERVRSWESRLTHG